jgi:hypothetical protein
MGWKSHGEKTSLYAQRIQLMDSEVCHYSLLEVSQTMQFDVFLLQTY